MALYFDDPAWHPLGPEDLRAFLARANSRLFSSDDTHPRRLMFERDAREPNAVAPSLVVESVDRRCLSFYPPGWALYRLACRIDRIVEMAGYEGIAYAFAIVGPERAPSNLVMIDWKSAVILSLNDECGLDLSRLDETQLREYLIFFCTFLGGDPSSSGVVAPFFLPANAHVFAWEVALEGLEDVARRRRLEMFAPIADADASDPFDLPEPHEHTHPRSHVGRPGRSGGISAETRRKAVQSAFAAHPTTPVLVTVEGLAGQDRATVRRLDGATTGAEGHPQPDEPATSGTAEWAATLEGLVWYGDTLFLATFKLGRAGSVEMLEDQPVADASSLPTPRWEVLRGPSDLWLLCRQLPREPIPASELRKRIEFDIAGNTTVDRAAGHQRVRLRGLRVEGPWEGAFIFEGPVRLSDIEFTDDVVLDDSIFERSLELVDCRFLQRFSARDMTVKGALRLDGSRIDGAIEFGTESGPKHPPPVLDLRGIKIERGFFADRLSLWGRFRGEWMRVDGAFRARGLQIQPRLTSRGASLDGACALDLSHAQIDGPLDMAGIAKWNEPGGRHRTWLCGAARLSGLAVDQVDLNGIAIRGSLDLSSCRIPGFLKISVLSFDSNGTSWRASIDDECSLDRAEAGRIEMNGCRVGGDLRLVDLKLSGTLFAELHGRFRTWIGGSLVGSGAQINGGLELEGARLGGRIEFVSGHIGRLYANAGAWACTDAVADSHLEPRFCACEACGIVLQDVSIDASVQLIGIQLRKGMGGYADGSLVAHAVRLGGGLRFWRGQVSEELLRRELARVARSSVGSEDEGVVVDARTDALIAGLSAVIEGTLDLQGLRAGGTTDLTRLCVSGTIDLDNAHIEGNLRVRSEFGQPTCRVGEPSRRVGGFNADIVQIDGDVDLRGLHIAHGDLSARDATVTGQVLLATPANRQDGEQPGEERHRGHAIVADGRIVLEGARAARLVFSGDNVCSAASDDRRAAIALSRGHFGQLTVLGFEKEPSGRLRFPRTVDLSAISVGDWDVKPDEEALPLLESTTPWWFDGRNFVDVEQRLAKIGRKKVANEAYRRMLCHGSRGFWARSIYLFNKCFSGNGTRPWLMVVWLLVFLLPVIYVLQDPVNVEFAAVANADGKIDTRPVSNGQEYVLDRDWDWIKATGLAATYALPFLGARADIVRARLVGKACIDHPLRTLLRQETKRSDIDARGVVRPTVAPAEPFCERGSLFFASPHEIAMMFSSIQFILWVVVAANLPAIARRRA